MNIMLPVTPLTISNTVKIISETHWKDWELQCDTLGLESDVNRDAELKHLFCLSDFAARIAIRHPATVKQFWDQGLSEARTIDQWQTMLSALINDKTLSETELMQQLRLIRQREMLRITWRDLLGHGSIESVLIELSELASVFIENALSFAESLLFPRFGLPYSDEGVQQTLLVIGMGKLGGGELNFSSDIDLIFAYQDQGQTNGKKSVDNAEYFTRLGQKLVKLLNETTGDGFVYRVDMRLRPFGSSGPLVLHFDALENYYLTQGREWERYAMIKAKVLTGEETAKQAFYELLRPFVFRRYIDYGAIEALGELKRRIAAQVASKGQGHSVKLGSGGIREIEFIAQAFQLVRGGQDVRLRARSLFETLDYIAEAGLLQETEVEDLFSAYRFLRRVENRLQMLADQQTHLLPNDELSQQRISLAMGFESWSDLITTLDQHRNRVQLLFESVFVAEKQDHHEIDPLVSMWAPDIDSESLSQLLFEEGFTSKADSLANHIINTHQGRSFASLTSRAQQRYETLLPMALRASLEYPNASETALRVAELMRAVAGRSVYLQMLIHNSSALQLLTKLFSASHWLAGFVVKSPIVIDELLDLQHFSELPSKEEMRSDLYNKIKGVDPLDTEAMLDQLRHFKQSHVMQIAVSDVLNQVTVMQVSDHLTWLAEVLLQAATDLAWQHMQRRHGNPYCIDRGASRKAEFGVVAYGKLGGIELGYSSDLDIVFIHDSTSEKAISDGQKPLENIQYFARLAQKVIQIISTVTTAGILYETDTRLRPNGVSGLMVTPLHAFREYQLDAAWTWEHQSLVRARMVVGSASIGQRFDAIRNEILSLDRNEIELKQSVSEMRHRMRVELSKGSSEQFDIKQDSGGVADIEFLVQYAVLRWSAKHPDLLMFSDVVRQLETLEKTKLISSTVKEDLINSYLYFRTLTHACALKDTKPLVEPSFFSNKYRALVTEQWEGLFSS